MYCVQCHLRRIINKSVVALQTWHRCLLCDCAGAAQNAWRSSAIPTWTQMNSVATRDPLPLKSLQRTALLSFLTTVGVALLKCPRCPSSKNPAISSCAEALHVSVLVQDGTQHVGNCPVCSMLRMQKAITHIWTELYCNHPCITVLMVRRILGFCWLVPLSPGMSDRMSKGAPVQGVLAQTS